MKYPDTFMYNGEVGILCGGELFAEIVEGNSDKAQYIVTAANLLPEFVDALDSLIKMLDAEGHAYRPKIEAAKKLLAKVKT